MQSLLLLDSKTNGARVANLALLKKINKKSIDKGYNRNLHWDVFKRDVLKAAGKDTSVLFYLYPLMVHEHKGGQKCEPHIRCEIDVSPYLNTFLTIDVPLEMYNSLMTLKFLRNSMIKEFC